MTEPLPPLDAIGQEIWKAACRWITAAQAWESRRYSGTAVWALGEAQEASKSLRSILAQHHPAIPSGDQQ